MCEQMFVAMADDPDAPHIDAPTLVFGPAEVFIDPGNIKAITESLVGYGANLIKPTVAVAADGSAAWITADADELTPKAHGNLTPPPTRRDHFTALFDGASWQPLAVAIAAPMTDQQQAQAIAKGLKLAPLARRVTGADEAVKLFEATIGDAKAFAATVSDRPDVVLFGSAPGEKFVGGKQVRAKIEGWKLAFTVRDGIQAGVTASKTVAWIAANLDATPAGKAGGKPAPYRGLFIYEKAATGWQLTSASFAYVASPGPPG